MRRHVSAVAELEGKSGRKKKTLYLGLLKFAPGQTLQSEQTNVVRLVSLYA